MENIMELRIIPSIQKKTPEMGAKGHTYIYITKQVNECKALRG